MEPRFEQTPADGAGDADDQQQISKEDLGTQDPQEMDVLDFKVAFQEACNAIKRKFEPYNQLCKVRDCLRHAIETDRMGRDEDFSNFVNSMFGSRMMPMMAREKSDDDDYLEVCAEILESWIRLFQKQMSMKRFDDNFICALTWCFQPGCNLHQNHFQYTHEELKKIAIGKQTWRNDIVEGSSLDVLLNLEKSSGWLQGTVMAVKDDQLSISFLDSDPEQDKDVDRWSTQIAKAGSKTKEDTEWRQANLVGKTDVVCDVYDGNDWMEATIFEIIDKTSKCGRVFPVCYVAYRVYREKGRNLRQDERGVYEGYASKFDEWIPLNSPNFAPHMTKSQCQEEKEDDDEDIDESIQPTLGFSRVYAVPRNYSSRSKKFIYLMDMFGNSGGFDALLETMESQELDDKNLTLTAVGYLVTLISMPAKLWHKDFVNEYGLRFCAAIEKRFLESDDVKLRELDQNCSYQAILATSMIKARLMPRAEAKKSMEVFNLKFTKRCLESQFLEKRIQGIKELNRIITDVTIGQDTQATAEIVSWIIENGVFNIIWDPKKTHIQLVQRSGDIFRCFLKEDLLNNMLLQMFWNLSKSDYKQEVFKIIDECGYYLDQEHIEFIFAQITQTPAVKLGIEEFEILSLLGRRCKLTNFTTQVSLYFWKIVSDSEAYNQEVLDCCVTKFAEMTKFWSIELKKPFFKHLVHFLKTSSAPTLPVLQLFQKIVSDHKDRERVQQKHSTMGSNGVNYGNVPKWINTMEAKDPVECHKVFDSIEEEHGFAQAVLDNLAGYFAKLSDQQIDSKVPRKSLKIVSEKYSHHEELEERLQFMQMYASNSSFEFTKVHLKIIYDLLLKSPCSGDLDQFLGWCKDACDNLTNKVFDLNEVGQFFSEQIDQKILDLKSMPETGFLFIQNFFVSANTDSKKMIKQEAPKKKKKQNKVNDWYDLWSEPAEEGDDQENQQSEEKTYFTITVDPTELEHLSIIWSIVLESQVKEVYVPAINLLVYSHLSNEKQEDAQEKRINHINNFLAKCFDLIKPEANPSAHMVSRITQVIKEVVEQSEKSGTLDVRPHQAILKGELLDRILIKYMSPVTNIWGDEKVERAIILKLYTSCTMWELKSEISRLLALAPKYLEIEVPGKITINAKQQGLSFQELGLSNNSIITVRKISIKEKIPQADLVDVETNWLVPKAQEIFTEWFEIFKNPLKGVMDNFSVARFITKSTKIYTSSSDEKVQELIQQYDQDNDGCLSLQEFLQFYYEAAEFPGEKRQACFKNMKNLNVRPDLTKLSDVVDKALFPSKKQMPRFALQANETQYQALWSLLDRNDETCKGTWELIRMLATNEKRYMEAIGMSKVTGEDGEVDWQAFFKGSNVYEKTYLQEIIMSVLEDSDEGQDQAKRIMFVEEQKIAAAYSAGVGLAKEENKESAPQGPQEQEAEDSEEEQRQAEATELRLNWSRNFLERGGFQFIMSDIYAMDLSSQVSMKNELEFMLTLVRVFMTAAFATDSHKNIGQAVRLTRKSSSIDDSDALDRKINKNKETKKDKLQELMNLEFGMEILLSTNYSRLLQKIVTLIFNVLQQDEQSLTDKITVENAMSIWVGITLYKPELFDEFLQIKHGDQSAEDFILSGLVFCKENKIRQDICQGLAALSKSIDQSHRQKVQSFVIGILGKNFLKIQDHLCSQYFDLFNELIDLQFLQDGLVDEVSVSMYDSEVLLHQIIDKILDSQKQEKDEDTDVVDEVALAEIAASKERPLVGLIVLVKKIIKTADKEISDKVIQDKNLVETFFKEFLFKSYFKAQQDQAQGIDQAMDLVQRGSDKDAKKGLQSNKLSREAAFSLLVELVNKSEVSLVTFLQMILGPMLNSVDKPKSWAYAPPSSKLMDEQKFVGLRNLGCICYMNSMMQQFYMIPALRYNLLCVEDGKEEEIVEYKGKLIDDNMFHQMQKLFAHLEVSERRDYNPLSFCFAFKEFDGGPTNIAEQKDAQEFLNLLFDRLETAIKGTSRKYLLQSIFGGKQCSQMVCTECGKVKNRHEEFLNLSLNIKDIKDVYQSLQKQIEGETISDYQCDGCNRKVDLSKRTLIAETPNILIIHLQRIGFNFETFETDKVNTLCKFPTMLDLKPYSYYEVMGKENRLKAGADQSEEEKAAAAKKKQEQEESMTEEELAKRREEEEETREPVKEDCFEYKLVGVNVHSGTANMGHYWSYINTNRGKDEKEGDTQWIRTDQDPWMEFNDSSVSNYSFSQLEKQCFGNDNPNGFMGNSYGTSGYMLFYERRRKKPIKILIDEDKVEEEKKAGVEVHYDEEKKENFKLVDYRKATEGEKPTPIYKQVVKDNNEYKFESDIFSQEFFNFVIEIMMAAAKSDSMDAKEMGLSLGKKVGFDILARCVDSSGLTHLSSVMIAILKSSDQVCLDFMTSLLDEDDAEPIMEILFECTKYNARKSLIKIIRFLVCRLKEIEKDLVLAGLTDTITETFTDIYGEQGTKQKHEPRALCLKFMANVKAYMTTRAARAWKIIDTYMELIFSFGVQSSEDIEKETLGNTQLHWSKDSVGYQVGMTEYFRKDMIADLGDFILQDNSPLYGGDTDYRFTMGNYNGSPDFEKAFHLICIMLGEHEIEKRFPMTDSAKKIGQSKHFLQQILRTSSDSFDSSKGELMEMLNNMAVNNYVNTKKLAKVFIRELLNKNTLIDIENGLKQVHSFLMIKDQLRQVRFEWIFGFGQVISKRTPGNVKKSVDVGLQCIDVLDKEAYQYKSGIVKAGGDALLTDIFKAQKQRVEFAILALLDLLVLCVEDEEIAEYIYNQPPPTYQYARYCDWFEPFAEEQKAHLLEQMETSQRYTNYQDLKDKQKLQLLTQILSLLPSFKEKCAKFEAKWLAEKDASKPTDFEGHQTVAMAGVNQEVIQHWPPQYIIGKPVSSESNEVVAEVENDYVTVRMTKMDIEYMYGNPTGRFNLSLPEKKVRNHLNFRKRETSYAEWKRAQASGTAEEFHQEDEIEDIDEEEDLTGLDVRQWHEHSLITDIYKIDVVNTCNQQVKVEVGIELEDPTEVLNCRLPLTSYTMQIFGNGITMRPITALITKIDPSKPMNKLKMTVGSKLIRSALSGISGGASGYTTTASRRDGLNLDPTYSSAYRDAVNQIRNIDGQRSVGFFVSEGNFGDNTENVDGGLGIQGTQIRLNGGDNTQGDDKDHLDLGNIPDIVGEDLGEDGEAGYMSNENNFGSDIDDDQLNK